MVSLFRVLVYATARKVGSITSRCSGNEPGKTEHETTAEIEPTGESEIREPSEERKKITGKIIRTAKDLSCLSLLFSTGWGCLGYFNHFLKTFMQKLRGRPKTGTSYLVFDLLLTIPYLLQVPGPITLSSRIGIALCMLIPCIPC